VRAPVHRGHTERLEHITDPDNLAGFVKKNYIDRIEHAKGVHALRRVNEEPTPSREMGSAKKTKESGQHSVRDADTVAESGSAGAVNDPQVARVRKSRMRGVNAYSIFFLRLAMRM
jgi:hypothetical protein